MKSYGFLSQKSFLLLSTPVLVFFLLYINVVNARTPDAENLAIGDWDVKVRCGSDFFHSLLFPLKIIQQPSSRGFLPRIWHLPFSPKEYPCQLSLYPNGTFTLQPTGDSVTYLAKRGDSDRLLVHGQWKVQANPYCITDRFYDQLTLESYPRKLIRRKTILQSSLTPSSTRSRSNRLAFVTRRTFRRERQHHHHRPSIIEDQIRWKLSLQMQCRIFGHYATPGPWRTLQRRRESQARLTHGAVLWKPTTNNVFKLSHNNKDSSRSRAIVGASFSGERMVQQRVQSKYQDNYEYDYFGY